jgi:hypothetical protein
LVGRLHFYDNLYDNLRAICIFAQRAICIFAQRAICIFAQQVCHALLFNPNALPLKRNF